MFGVTRLRVNLMVTCSTCGMSFDNASRFCPKCGSLPEQAKSFSYGGSVVVAVVLIAVVLMWELGSLAPSRAITQTATPQAPDDAAMLITNCGQPDADVPDISNTLQRRSLLYQKSKVKAVFVRSEPSSRWKTQVMLDTKTLQPLTTDKLAKRMPCALSKASLGTGKAQNMK